MFFITSSAPRSVTGVATQPVRTLGLSTAFVLMCGSASAQTSGLEAYNAYVADLTALGIEVETGAINYDGTTDTLTITDSVLSLTGMIDDLPLDDSKLDPPKRTDLTYALSFSTGSMEITGLTADGGVYSADRWSYADDSAFRVTGEAEGEARLELDGRMAGISATDYSFTMPQVPDEDPARPASRWLPFLVAMSQMSYTDIKVDSTAATFEAFSLENGDEFLAASGTLQLDGYQSLNAVDGRVGEYSFDRATQTILTRDDASGQMLSQSTRQGKTIYEEVNIRAVAELLDPSVPETGEELTLIGYGSSIDYESVQDIGDGLSIGLKADRSTLRDLTITKRDNDVLGLLDQLLTQQVPPTDDLIIDFFQLYRAFGIGDARISGLTVDVPMPELDKSTSMTIEQMAMTEVNSSGIGEMILVGLDAPELPEGASVKLDWAAIGDIEFADFPPMETMIRKLVEDPDYGEQNPLEVARAFVPFSFGYEIEGLDVNVPAEGRIEIGKAELALSSTVPPIPTSFYSKNDGIRIPVSALDDDEAEAVLRSIGIEDIVWSDETRLYWDEATKELRLERLKMQMDGIGTAEASIRLANVPRELFEDPEGQGQVAMVVAQFVDARFSFVDDGVTELGLESMAEEQNLPADVFKQVLVEQATEATAVIQNPAFTAMVRTAVSDFLDKPGQITLTMSPPSPVPVAQLLGSMAAPQTLPDLLNIRITAN